MTKRVEFLVAFDLPRNCTAKHAGDTLMNHLTAMGGNLHPPHAEGPHDKGDPMFEFDHATATVTAVRGKRKK